MSGKDLLGTSCCWWRRKGQNGNNTEMMNNNVSALSRLARTPPLAHSVVLTHCVVSEAPQRILRHPLWPLSEITLSGHHEYSTQGRTITTAPPTVCIYSFLIPHEGPNLDTLPCRKILRPRNINRGMPASPSGNILLGIVMLEYQDLFGVHITQVMPPMI